MSKKKNEDRYILQPKISPPQPKMQSHYRFAVSNQTKDAMKGEDEIIRVVSSEKIHKDTESDWVEVNEAQQEEWERVVEVSTGVSSEVEKGASEREVSENKSDN